MVAKYVPAANPAGLAVSVSVAGVDVGPVNESQLPPVPGTTVALIGAEVPLLEIVIAAERFSVPFGGAEKAAFSALEMVGCVFTFTVTVDVVVVVTYGAKSAGTFSVNVTVA
jgi:hypothetical protein